MAKKAEDSAKSAFKEEKKAWNTAIKAAQKNEKKPTKVYANFGNAATDNANIISNTNF